MKYFVSQINDLKIIECDPLIRQLENEQDALDLLGICGEHETNLLLLHAENFHPDFFNLKTGVAGAILLKFTNYHIRAAALIPAEIANQGRFGEMVLETNRGRQFYVTDDREKAIQWLLKS